MNWNWAKAAALLAAREKLNPGSLAFIIDIPTCGLSYSVAISFNDVPIHNYALAVTKFTQFGKLGYSKSVITNIKNIETDSNRIT